MENRINFICKACLTARPGRESPVMAIAIRNSGRPDEITKDGWGLIQLRPEQLGKADAAERVLPTAKLYDHIIRGITADTRINAIVDLPQDVDPTVKAKYSREEWHEHRAVRNVAFQGGSNSYDHAGTTVFMHYPRVVTLPFPNEGRADLQCSYGHKSQMTRAELVKAAGKAIDKGETS